MDNAQPGEASQDWLVFLYQMPAKPAGPRAVVRRELKRLGAVWFQHAVAVVPERADLREALGIGQLGQGPTAAAQLQALEASRRAQAAQISTDAIRSDDALGLLQDLDQLGGGSSFWQMPAPAE